MKKYVAEFIGTAVLTGMGCGAAMLVGCEKGTAAYLIVALVFGLSIVAEAYSIGNISGCHINPAVSLGVLISGGMSVGDFFGYVIAQILGAFLGTALDAVVLGLAGLKDMTGAFGANGFSGVNGSAGAAFLVELILTFIFVLTVLGVTSRKAGHGSFGGLVIGLTLFFVHLVGIGLTGTSANPARSIAPAVFAAANGNAAPLSQLWVFILAPLVGGALAACCYKFLEQEA